MSIVDYACFLPVIVDPQHYLRLVGEIGSQDLF